MAGRNSKFTKSTKNKIYKAIREGEPYKIAAAYAGIGQSTFQMWKAKAVACSQVNNWIDVDKKHNIKDEADFLEFLEFLEELTRAQAGGEVARAARIAKAGRGGIKETEERVTVRDTITPQGQIVQLNEKVVITRKLAPDWRADAFVQSVRHPERWAKKDKHEISGPDGGAIEVQSSPPDLDKLSSDELEKLAQIAEKLQGSSSGVESQE